MQPGSSIRRGHILSPEVSHGSQGVGDTTPETPTAQSGAAEAKRAVASFHRDAKKAEKLDPALALVLREQATMLENLLRYPPAVTVFGSARTKPGQPLYEQVVRLGQRLAEEGLPVRTGDGPGAMEAALRGAKKSPALDTPVQTIGQSPFGDDTLLRQGVQIRLPQEQRPSGFSQATFVAELFAFRKEGLYLNARGFVFCPGGFGTMEEWFEVLALTEHGALRDRTFLLNKDFYGPLFKTFGDHFVGEQGLNPAVWSGQRLEDGEQARIAQALAEAPAIAFEEHPLAMIRRKATEIAKGFAAVRNLPPAATLVASENLEANHPSARVLAKVAERLAEYCVPVRSVSTGPVGREIAKAVRSVNRLQHVQAFPMAKNHKAGNGRGTGLAVAAQFSDLISQRETVMQGTRALIVAKPDLHAMCLLFNVLCEVQTGKRPRIPIVLVGMDKEWRALTETLRQVMLSSQPPMIGANDMDLLTVTSDPETIARLVVDQNPGAFPQVCSLEWRNLARKP